jgi:uracil-DNA glycosylase family 4
LQPARDCPLCPRLKAFRDQNAAKFPGYFNAPVPPFGDKGARLLIVGLAPGLHGANRTGRPFTGDYAGNLLYSTLKTFGFAVGDYGAEADDGLTLRDARITNAVKCLPPENKPEPAEIRTCGRFLASEMADACDVRAVLALGLIAHNAVLTDAGLKKSGFRFAHGARHALPGGRVLFDSYHCSRYNTNTGRLTEAMFHAVFGAIAAELAK